MVKRTILCIDDDKNSVVSIKEFLEPLGYALVAAYDGATGVAKTKETRPDLILLDLVLPDCSGFKVAHDIRNLPGCNDLPIIAISLRKEEVDKHVAAVSGIADYLEKPLDMERLAYSIKEALPPQD